MARKGTGSGKAGSKTNKGGQAKAASGGAEPAAQDTAPKRKSNPFQFAQEVRQETAKVTWPTRNETLVTTVMVFIMVFLAGIFFFLVDTVWRWVFGFIFG